MENLFFNSLNQNFKNNEKTLLKKLRLISQQKKIVTDYEVHSTKGMGRALKGSLGESVPPSH